jgi:hypothetical protein
VEIRALHLRLKTTTVYVTHDQIEAMTMADRIVVMKDGHIAQAGAPLDLYDRPQNTFVAGFIGSPSMNLIEGVGQGASVAAGPSSLPAMGVAEGRPVIYGIRPEHWQLGASLEAPGVDAVVKVVEPTGAPRRISWPRRGGARSSPSRATALACARRPHPPAADPVPRPSLRRRDGRAHQLTPHGAGPNRTPTHQQGRHMLKGIDNRLGPGRALCATRHGHGRPSGVCDTNFPADSIARHTALASFCTWTTSRLTRPSRRSCRSCRSTPSWRTSPPYGGRGRPSDIPAVQTRGATRH